MALGKIKADTLEHSTAGSIATNFVVEGSAKSWLNLNGTGTIAAQDSFNISSITDSATGKYHPVMASAMGNANYSLSGYSNHDAGNSFYAGGGLGLGVNIDVTKTASTYDVLSYSNNFIDSKYVYTSVFGDLA